MESRHTTEITKQLKGHGLRRTSFREEVLCIFHDSPGKALSNRDIEVGLEDGFDRITLYRTLKSFEEHGIIHQFVDADGKMKYAICNHQCDQHHHEDGHAHFHCSACGETKCLYDSLTKLEYNLPVGYEVADTRVLLTGMCGDCK